MIFLTLIWRLTYQALQCKVMRERVNAHTYEQEVYELEKPAEACGVIGMYAPGEPVATLTYNALHELQHRGQSGAGVYIHNGMMPMGHKGNGLIDAAIPEAPAKMVALDTLNASVAIGHTRYSTSESNNAAQPYEGPRSNIAVAHNGHIEEIDKVAAKYGITPEQYASDSQALTLLLDARTAQLGSIEIALKEILVQLDGAYCLTITDGNRLIGVRDPWGLRPLSVGMLPEGKGYMIASEIVAMKDCAEVRDVEPGEIVIVTENGVVSHGIERQEPRSECAFEYIYFARPDSVINGKSVYAARKKLGHYLALDDQLDADVVVGVPSSGLPAAEGYAETSGIKSVLGIFKNPYVSRSFIEREDKREKILRDKFHPNTGELLNQRVVLIDDSLIKGNTMRILVDMIREAGAVEVHVRSSAPRYAYPCYMGMDTSDTSKLIARQMEDEQIAQTIGADSIRFNTAERVQRAVAEASMSAPQAIPLLGQLCMACVTGKYPVTLSPELHQRATFIESPRSKAS